MLDHNHLLLLRGGLWLRGLIVLLLWRSGVDDVPGSINVRAAVA